jgi:hypothetical protein
VQFVQVVDCATVVAVPAAQLMHAVMPGAGPKVPVGHAEQVAWPGEST